MTTQTTPMSEYEILSQFASDEPAPRWTAADTAANLYSKVRAGKLTAKSALAKMPKSHLAAPWIARIRDEFGA